MSDTREYSSIKQDSLTIYLKTSRCKVSLFSAVSENAFAMTQQLTRIISLLRRHFYSLLHVTHVSSRNHALFITSGPEKAGTEIFAASFPVVLGDLTSSHRTVQLTKRSRPRNDPQPLNDPLSDPEMTD